MPIDIIPLNLFKLMCIYVIIFLLSVFKCYQTLFFKENFLNTDTERCLEWSSCLPRENYGAFFLPQDIHRTVTHEFYGWR